MRCPALLCVATVLGAALAAHGQQEIASGRWSARLGPAGPETVSYDGERLAFSGTAGVFTPDYKAVRIAMGESSLTVDGARATWVKDNAAGESCTLTLELSPEGCTYSMALTAAAPGPTEWALCLDPDAVRASDEHCFARVNDAATWLELAGTIDAIGGIGRLELLQPDRTVLVRTTDPWLMLQDRRASNSGFFLVRSFPGSDGTPVSYEANLHLTVTDVPEAERPGRAMLVSQRATERRTLPVANGDFEAPDRLASWSDNPCAAVDTAVFHSGKQSARLTLSDIGQGDNVYLTQMVPVTPGAAYRAQVWIRTQDVVSAEVGGRSATGGAIIVEFADPKGNWMAAGGYSSGVYGTSDWKQIEVGGVRAPLGSGYAVVFLALRALGTVWFDDVTLDETKSNIVLESPPDGSAVDDNTPLLSWQSVLHGPALIELCDDAAFPADRVVRVTAGETQSASPPAPLAPGDWFWRVAMPDFGLESATWRITQTAPLDRDCTDPAIAETSRFLPGARDDAVLGFSDNVGVTQLQVAVDGEDVTPSLRVEAERATCCPVGGWTEGLHRAEVTASDAAGNSAARSVYFTHFAELPRKVWTADGGIGIDGEKRFLLGMYGVREEDMPELAAAGVNYVHNYAWDGPASNESAIAYLDACQKLGLQAFIGFDRQRLRAGDFAFVAERVGALMSHPALLAWYLFDEPDAPEQYASPDLLGRLRHFINGLDPFHPTVVVVADSGKVGAYNDAFDVHWTEEYSNPASIARRMDRDRASLKPGQPLAAIVHCYDTTQTNEMRAGVEPDAARFRPDAAMLRANAFMAIAHGSSGISWWWWGQGSADFFTVASAPEAWAALKQVFADIHALEPVLTAPGDARMWAEAAGPDREVHFWEKELVDRTVIIAVNRDAQACDVTFSPESVPADCTLKVLFEPEREVAVTGGKCTDTFGPLGVHVYEFRR